MKQSRYVFGPYSEPFVIMLKEDIATTQASFRVAECSLASLDMATIASWNNPTVSVHILPAAHILELEVTDMSLYQPFAGQRFTPRLQFDVRQVPVRTVGQPPAASTSDSGSNGRGTADAEVGGPGGFPPGPCIVPECLPSTRNCEPGEQGACDTSGRTQCVYPPDKPNCDRC